MFNREHDRRKKARALGTRTGYKMGGHFGREPKADYESDKKMVMAGVHAHERNMHQGEKETKLKLADGGSASGDAAPHRGDKGRRGKGGSGKTHVNILIAPQGDKAGAGGGLPTAPPPGPPPGPPPVAPPRPPMPPMAPPTGNAPMGVGAPQGGMPPIPNRPIPPPGAGMPPPMMRKSGGRAGYHPPKMTAGAGSGEGRLQKIGRD